MTATRDLACLVRPPVNVRLSPDWGAFEERLGWRLPADYKWLVEKYGPGSFDDFLHILQPGSEFESISLETSYSRTVEILSQLKAGGEGIPYEIFELAPVAKTDNGDTIYWVRRPMADPDSWSITANAARGFKWAQFSGGIVEFLTAVLSGAHRVEIFPDDFPDLQPEFEQY